MMTSQHHYSTVYQLRLLERIVLLRQETEEGKESMWYEDDLSGSSHIKDFKIPDLIIILADVAVHEHNDVVHEDSFST